MALHLGGFTKVHRVFSSQQLLDRDKEEFADYLHLIDDESQVEDHVGVVGFEVKEGELAIVDEADNVMHGDPAIFFDFMSKCACICYTATPDDQDILSTDIKMLSSMKFKTLYYELDKAQQKIKLDFDEIVIAATVKEKAEKIKEYSVNGPVVTFCDADLHEELKKQELEILVSDQHVNHLELKVLGQ